MQQWLENNVGVQNDAWKRCPGWCPKVCLISFKTKSTEAYMAGQGSGKSGGKMGRGHTDGAGIEVGFGDEVRVVLRRRKVELDLRNGLQIGPELMKSLSSPGKAVMWDIKMGVGSVDMNKTQRKRGYTCVMSSPRPHSSPPADTTLG